MENSQLEAALEAILFASGEPIKISRIADVLEVPQSAIEEAFEKRAGKYRYEQRGIRLVRLAETLQMVSAPEFSDTIRKVLEERKPPPMSRAALEVLSVAAYYQPVTKAQVERARGIESGATINGLTEKGLLCESGRLEVPGRPILYKTTPAFLRAFGLSNLEELPNPELSGQLTLGDAPSQMEYNKCSSPE